LSLLDSVYEGERIPPWDMGCPFDMGEEMPNARAAVKSGAKLFNADRLIPAKMAPSP